MKMTEEEYGDKIEKIELEIIYRFIDFAKENNLSNEEYFLMVTTVLTRLLSSKVTTTLTSRVSSLGFLKECFNAGESIINSIWDGLEEELKNL